MLLLYYNVFHGEIAIHQFVLFTHRNHFPLAGVADAQTSVLAGGAKQAAVSVPADAVDEVWMVVHGDEGLTRSHVPDYNQVITAWREAKDGFVNAVTLTAVS